MADVTDADSLAGSVRESLRIRPGDDDGLVDAAAAVLALVTRWHGDAAEWDDAVLQGARMLTARLWRRRQSPAGVESVGDLGAVYVQRRDPDVALLLGLGSYRPPLVG